MTDGRKRPRPSAALGTSRAWKRARVRWSVALGEQFLAIVRETGNARAAAAALGAPNAFNKRMKRDPEFRRRAMEAATEADARLRRAENAFPDGADSSRSSNGHAGPPPPRFGRSPSPSRGGAEGDLGGLLRRGRKRAQERPEPVIRRNSQGRYQVTFAREGHWTADIEADFLARLAATGNFDACARAVGFQPASVHERVRKWAAFRRSVDEALEGADARLGYALVAHAHALLRRPDEARPEGEPDVPFDPKAAMQILAFLDARRGGRTRRGPRKGLPDKSFEQAVESVLAKIDAIERHEALTRQKDALPGTRARSAKEREEKEG